MGKINYRKHSATATVTSTSTKIRVGGSSTVSNELQPQVVEDNSNGGLAPEVLESAPEPAVLEPEVLESAPKPEPEVVEEEVTEEVAEETTEETTEPEPEPEVVVEEEPKAIGLDLVFHIDAEDYTGSGKTCPAKIGNEGNLIGNTAHSTDAPTFFTLDGNGDYIMTICNPATRTPEITTEQWIAAANWSAGSSTNYKVAMSCAEYGGYRNSIFGGDFVSAVYANKDYVVAKTDVSNFENNSWHHFVTTYDGHYLKIYVDGTLVDTVDAGGDYPITYSKTNSLLIGAEANTGTGSDGKYWTGNVALTRVYNGAHSAEKVATLYDESKARFGK